MKSLRLILEVAALQRKKYLDLVTDRSYVIGQHMILIQMYPDARDQAHWRSEIRSHVIPLFAKIKSGSNIAKAEILHKYLVDQFYDNFEDNQRMSDVIWEIDDMKPDYQLTNSSKATWLAIKPSVIDAYDALINAIISDDRRLLKTVINQM